MWNKIVDIINEGRKFIITSHLFLEGDAIGSEIALKHFLKGLGKEAVIMNNEAMPVAYRYFDPNKEVKFFKKTCPDEGREGDALYQHRTPRGVSYCGGTGNEIKLQDFDAIFIVDVGSWKQLGDFAEVIKSSSITTINIDHHQSNPGLGDINVVDQYASSAGELIFDLISYMHGKITKEIAEPLYLSIASDTGWFKFSNTSAKAFSICSTLLKSGVEPEIIYEKVCQNKSWSYLKLTALTLEALHTECEGHLAWTKITREMLKASGVEYVDTDIIMDLVRAVGDVNVVILFRELSDERSKASFRSKHTIDVSKLASKFGGGGHKRAAGATLEGPIDIVIEKVLSEANAFMGKAAVCASPHGS